MWNYLYKLLNKKIIHSILCGVLCFLSMNFVAVAQNSVVDADSLGDIWAVTIDQSFSMMRKKVSKNQYENRDVDAMSRDVANRLRDGNILRDVDWKHDRFIFYTSGISDGMSKTLHNIRNFDTSFIHHTDGIYYQFESPKTFSSYVYEKMSKLNYKKYYQSFVSQMRTMTLKKTIEHAAATIGADAYRNIRIITVSDDAVDQKDQWQTDYRTLKDSAPEKVEYLSRVTSRLVYNPLNGMGGGNLDLIKSDESAIPHIWLYDYVTSEGRRIFDTLTPFFRVDAPGGGRFTIELNSNDSVVMCRIDSIAIGTYMIPVGRYFLSELKDSGFYKNSFPLNDVTLYGKVQIQYYDSILGPHFRTVEFVQHTASLTTLAKSSRNTLIAVIILAVLCILYFYLIFNPRRILFSLYSGEKNRCISVKRGFRGHWKSDRVPLVAFLKTKNGSTQVMFKSDSHVNVTEIDATNSTASKEVLIISRRRLNLSVDCKFAFNSNKDDIDSFFSTRSDDYPIMLNNVYSKSFAAFAYKSANKKNAVVSLFGKTAVAILRMLRLGNYYYCLTLNQKYVSVDSSLLKNISFLIEKESISTELDDNKAAMQQSLLFHNGKISSAVIGSEVYMISEKIHNDSRVVVICRELERGRQWDVLLTERIIGARSSLRNVTWVYSYTVKTSLDTFATEKDQLLRYVKRHYGESPCFYHLVQKKSASVVRANISVPDYFLFEKSYQMAFLSLVSSDASHQITPIYSPFTNGRNKSTQFRLRAKLTHNLYASFLPFREAGEVNPDYCVQISNNLIDPVSHDIPTAEFVIESENSCRVDGVLIKLTSDNF